MTELVLANARVVTADAVIEGSVRVRDGRIVEIAAGPSHAAGALDLDGDYLLPGLVELHTDNLERHISPRPGVRWPAPAAVVAHDAQIAAAGITTVFDALAVGDVLEGSQRLANLTAMGTAVASLREAGMLKAEHWLHMRCEVSHPTLGELFQPFVDHPLVRLVSLMDHTPGQRQFARLDKYREYYQGKYGLSDDAMARFIDEKRDNQERYSAAHRTLIVELCRTRRLRMASHDDATIDHVEEAADAGMVVAEFPTTLDAARAARSHRMKVMGGAPNLVRGGSHSGNVSAHELAEAGLVDILSSDYVPSSLLQAAFLLARPGSAITLPQAVATVTATPAAAVGLADRGTIAPGLRADLVRVADRTDLPIARAVWREGERIA